MNIMKRTMIATLILTVLSAPFFTTTTTSATENVTEIHILAGANLKFNITSFEVPVGGRVRIIAEGAGAFHTFTLDSKTIVDDNNNPISLELNAGDVKTVEFTTPSTAQDVRYYCIPHESLGMEGVMKVVENLSPSSSSNSNTNSSPFPLIGIFAFLAIIPILKRNSSM